MNLAISAGHSSFPRKRESRACPWLEQGAAGPQRSPWTPAFAGVTCNMLILFSPFRVRHSVVEILSAPASESAGSVRRALFSAGEARAVPPGSDIVQQ